MKVIASKALTAGQVKNYHEGQYARGDYYSEAGHVQGRWNGKGAAMMGLGGNVDGEHLYALADGIHPHTREQLVAGVNRGSQEIKRAAFDFPIMANKSISLQSEQDPLIREEFEQVNIDMIAQLERFVQVRVDAGRDREATGNLIAATYIHDVDRPNKESDAIAPHLHAHNGILNISFDRDGRARAIDPNQLYRAQKWASRYVDVEMSKRLQKLGYEVQWTKNGPEIAGYSREAIDAYSPRHNDIVARGGANMDRAAEEKLQRNTRNSKKTLTPEARAALGAQVIADLKEYHGIDAAQMHRDALDRGPVAELSAAQRHKLAAEAVRFGVEHHVERRSISDARDIESSALQHGQGQIDLDDVRSAIRDGMRLGDLHLAALPGSVAGITTREMLATEQNNERIMLAGRGRGAEIGSAEVLDRYIADYRHPEHGYQYSQDQAHVIRMIGSSPDQVAFLEGKPGASKTTTLGGLVEYYRQQGYEVRGYGPTTAAVRALKDAGVDNTVTAQSLHTTETRVEGAARREIWITDESSQWSTRMAHDLMTRAEREQPAKLIWSGDQRQHGAVEAGNAIEQMEQAAERAGMQIARLEIIRRQKDPLLREAVDLMSRGRLTEGYQRLDQLGRVHDVASVAHASGLDPESLTAEQRREIEVHATAQRYLEGERTMGSAMVITSTHADRRADNEAIRGLKIAAGEVARDGYRTTIYSQLDRTRAERQWAGSYDEGDRLTYHFRGRAVGVERGDAGVVLGLNAEQNRISVRLDSGREITYDPRRLSGVSVHREEERDFGVGDTVITTQAYRDQGVANGDIGRVKTITTDGKATVEWQGVGAQPARTMEIDLQTMRGIDHGYAATSQHLQGLQTGTAVVHSPRDAKAALVGASRGVQDIQVVTADSEEMMRRVQWQEERRGAREGVREAGREIGGGSLDTTLLIGRYVAAAGLREYMPGRSGPDTLRREREAQISRDGMEGVDLAASASRSREIERDM